MRLLFVDDERENVEFAASTLERSLGLEVRLESTVEGAIAALVSESFDIVVMDVFLPLGEQPHKAMGPRARRVAEDVQHLGGLVLLDEIDRLPNPPKVLVHTACNDHALISILAQHHAWRVPKPAPAEVLLRAVMEALTER